ncbi:SIR2 family protein [Fibrobacter sp. UBA4297]|uniref:SIR2 family protein n=1 Tax=Fibrobacter sp. UBA4297 TaxID=1946536 RepID=UPI0025BA6B0F|nr:SIR2 family protein [Fibrobacter sp. UBA4297]
MSLSSKKYNFENEDFDFFDEYYNKELNEDDRLKLSIDYIEYKLNDKSMSAIVGAGFSLNSNPSFPDWANLLIDAFNEMYPNEICRNDKESEINYNKRVAKEIQNRREPVVAAEYEKYKGNRESLDIYIENHILQKQELSQNLSIHEAFLKLNWCDIITTNWDNLLESADKDERYEVVRSAKDLKHCNKDRIVKIHGSLRSKTEREEQKYEFDDCFDHLYLITEKDFENYAVNHEGFSNFMKVKILENSFCLFGFSGNDWNFKYWVKELKRIMIKGGHASNLNPIFLFDVSEKDYKIEQKQFFRNNYIIPLKLDDFVRVLNSPAYVQPFDVMLEENQYKDLSDRSQEIPENFSKIFSYFIQKQREKESERMSYEDNLKIDVNKILNKLACFPKDRLSVDLMQEYIDLPKFKVNELYYRQLVVDKIQFLGKDKGLWGEIEYLFVYTWCLNNFFSLTQLFDIDNIELIIRHFVEKKIYLTKAIVFSELIFKYYFDCNKYNKFEEFASLIENKSEDIVDYQRCKFYFKNLEYEELETKIKGWFPEKKKDANPLHILCKITFLLVLEGVYNYTNVELIRNLFEILLKKCNKEPQLKLFILLYYRYYISNKNSEIYQRLTKSINELRSLDLNYPNRYIEILVEEKTKENLDITKPNSKKRHQTTISIPSNNYEKIKYRCLLNFFEYLNIPMEGIISESKFVELIYKVDDGCLYELFPYSFYYFGHSSDEEYMQTVMPLFLRRLSKDTQLFLFEKYINLFKSKEDGGGNLQMLCFLMNEIAKRVENNDAKKYYNLFFERFFNNTDKSLQILANNGKRWGIHDPFVDFLKQIDDEEQLNKILHWIIDNCLMLSKDDFAISYYEDYYIAILNDKKKKTYLTAFYSDDSIISKLLESFKKHYFLALDAFVFLNDEMKEKCTNFLKETISLEINPNVLKNCYSDEAKEKVISIIATSTNFPIDRAVGFIRVLKNLEKLEVADLKKICPSINKVAEKYQKNALSRDRYRYIIKPYYELIYDFYESDNSDLKSAVEESINVFKPIYEEEANKILTFDWISTQDKQMFRDSFFDSFTYSVIMNRKNELIPCVGMALSKIYLDDDFGDMSKYEAVLEIFVHYCGYEKWFSLFKENSLIKFGIIRILRKFKQKIPLCYDDLFIREQMFKLADIAEKMGIEDESVMYWKNESIGDAIDSL